jgi:hypothetical protein
VRNEGGEHPYLTVGRLGESWVQRWLQARGNTVPDVRDNGYWQFRDIDFRIVTDTPRSSHSEWTVEVKTSAISWKTGKIYFELSRSTARHPRPEPGAFFRSQADYWAYVVLDEDKQHGSCYLFRLDRARRWLLQNAHLVRARFSESPDPLNGIVTRREIVAIPIETFIKGTRAAQFRLPNP